MSKIKRFFKKHNLIFIKSIYIMIVCLIIIVISIVSYNMKQSERNRILNKKDEEIRILKEERDMYKKRWEFRDDVADYYYKEYLKLKEKYEKLKSSGIIQ